MSIAVLHHLSTEERRLAAMQEMVRLVKRGGCLLIVVWAREQTGHHAYSPLAQDSANIMVPWKSGDRTFLRFYHLFEEHELESLVSMVEGVEVAESGYDRDNWYVVANKA